MSFVAAAVIGGATLATGLTTAGLQIHQGKKKEQQGRNEAFKAGLQETVSELSNKQAQDAEKDKMEALAGQRMTEISALQSKYDERAKEGVPAEIREQYLENIDNSQANALNSIGSRRGGLVGVSNVNQNAVGAYKDLLAMDANQRLQNEQAALSFEGSAIGQRDVLANRGLNYGIGVREENFDRNMSNIYADQDYAMALQGAGEQMRYNGYEQGINTLGETASFAAGGGFSALGGLGGGGAANATKSAATNLQTSAGGFGQQQGWGTQYQQPSSGFDTQITAPNIGIRRPSYVGGGLDYGNSSLLGK